MAGQSRKALILGFAGAVALLAGLFVLVGPQDVLELLATAKPLYVGLTLALAIGWLIAWGLMLRQVLSTLGIDIRFTTSFFVYTAVVFANNITPFAQAGGEPIAALLVSKVSESRYETGLAGIASVDISNVLASVILIVLGIGYHATTATIGDRLETAVGSAVVLIGTISVVLVLVWRYRQTLIERVPAIVAPPIVRAYPGRSDVPTLEGSLTERLTSLFENFERIGDDRIGLGTIIFLSVLGWLCQAGALLTAFEAFGYTISPAIVLFTIPLANLAGATPLPGGLGGIEAALVALLVPTTGIAAATVTAAVVLFRGIIYWFPVAVGGATTAALGVRSVV